MRQDIPAEQQIVQSTHAAFSIATAMQLPFSIPNIVVIGVPDVAALNRVQAKLKGSHIPHYVWVEPDFDMGFTAIATVPLDAEKKQVLMNYRLLKFRPENFNQIPRSSIAEREPLKLAVAGASPAEGAMPV